MTNPTRSSSRIRIGADRSVLATDTASLPPAPRLGRRKPPTGARNRTIPRSMSYLLATLLAAQALASQATPARASVHHDTNPVTSVCGNGSHPVKTWRSYYIRASNVNNNLGAIIGRVDIRYSKYCNTVWARVANLTGPGHYGGQSMSILGMAKIFTYNCALESCDVASDSSGYSTLPASGHTVFSNQLDLPTGQLRSGDRMPPTVEAEGWADVGANTYHRSSGREPVFTQWESNFSNQWWERDPGSTRILSCENNLEPCESWGLDGGSWVTLQAEFLPSFALTGVDEDADLNNIIKKWNYASLNAPLVQVCSGSCVEDIQVKGVFNLGSPGSTSRDGSNGLLDHAVVSFDTAPTWDHGCGTEGDGCEGGGPGFDSRPVLSHEWAHALGFTHCDLDFGVMCHITANNDNDEAEGTMFWTPQLRDVWGLKAAYPD